jgi:uncharacterized membrane-anchored protein
VIRRVVILIGLLVSAGLVTWEVSKKERLLASGATVLLELAPVDPRSLMQGDYMRLDYAIARQWRQDASWPREGAVVVAVDESGVAQFQRRDQGEPLATGEYRLTYRVRNGRMRVGVDAFYFQDGLADTYQPARYGEMRVAADGTSLLVRLRDADRRPLGPAGRY